MIDLRILAVFCVLACVGLVGCSLNQTEGLPSARSDPFFCATGIPSHLAEVIKPPPPNLEAMRRLSYGITLEEKDYTLQALAERIKQRVEIEIAFDWDGLEKVGVTRRTTIPTRAGSTTAERALTMMLWHSSPENKEHYPTYMLVDGVVVVGTNRSLVKILPQVNWPARDGQTSDVAKDETAEIKLVNTTIKLENDNLSLDQVLTLAQERTGLEFVINWTAMELVGVDKDSLVTISLEHLPIDSLLELTMDQVSHDNFNEDKVNYQIHDGQVIVSTLRDIYLQTIVTRTYPIDDLTRQPFGPTLAALYEDDPLALKLLRSYGLEWHARWPKSVKSQFKYSEITPTELAAITQRDRGNIAEEIGEMAGSIAYAEPWIDSNWSVHAIGDVLHVKAAGEVHREIEQMLSRLRENRRWTILRFVRELEATRLLKQAEQARQAGELKRAKALIDKAHHLDPGNDVAWSLLQLLKEQADPDPPSSE